MDLKHLVSGTDIRGIVSEFEGKKVNLTKNEVEFIGKAFGNWITKKYGRKSELENRKIKVSVGYDARHTGSEFSKILRNVLKNMEIDVYDCQMSITPSLFMTTIFENYKADGAIMITASHLPSYYNGLKFFTIEGGLEKTDVLEMLEMGNEKSCQCEANLKEALEIGEKKGRSSTKKLAEDYAEYTCEFIRKETGEEKPLKDLKIVIDAGNGAAGFFADKVIRELGGNPEGSQFLNPDGDFPNHIPNPEAKEAIESVKKAVLDNNADFGIIFDADGDRSAFIDKNGREINRNNLIALLSEILLKEHSGGIIVTDSITSAGLKEFIENRGGIHHRFQRGYKNVINESIRLNNEGKYSPLAIETSGHAAFKENYFLDDGAYMAARLLIQLVESREKGVEFTDVLNELPEPVEEIEIRIPIKDKDFRACGEKIVENFREYAEKKEDWSLESPNYEGVRVNVGQKSWFLIRLSLHEPLLCVNIEAEKKGMGNDILEELKDYLKKYEKMEI